MQETPADRLLPAVVERMRAGPTSASSWRPPPWPTPARSAARTTTATTRSWRCCRPTRCRASCPRRSGPCRSSRCSTATPTTSRTSAAASHEALHPLEAAPLPEGQAGRRGPPRGDPPAGHGRRPSGPSPRWPRGPLDEAYNDLQYLVQDNINVHRVVLAWRAWALLDLTGKEHAHTLLRQSVRFCVDEEAQRPQIRLGRAPCEPCCPGCSTSTA